jgi:protein involved in polysaccharide export with SLBB domain
LITLRFLAVQPHSLINLGFAAVLCIAASAASAGDYALGPGDRLDISILSRPDLSRVYRVRSDGAVSLHFIGRVQAEGRTPAELESLLEARLGEVFEGVTSATIEVAEHRPVTIGGHVAAPGAYQFRPGLDVARAVALAGGRYRLADQSGVAALMRVEAEAARHALLRTRLASALVERARLAAERDDAPRMAAPEEARAILKNDAQDLATVQSAVREARDQQVSLRIADATAALRLAETEASAYAERQELIRRQLDATLVELAKQEDLAERGLGRAARLFDLRLSAEGHRVNELEAVALEAEARQRISEAAAGINETSIARTRDVAENLAALDAEILEIRSEIDQARRFVQVFGGGAALGEPLDEGLVYTIRRRGAQGVTVIAAAPDTTLAPGDLLEVAAGPAQELVPRDGARGE